MLAYVPVALWAIVAVVAILMVIFGDEKFQAIILAVCSMIALVVAIVVDGQLGVLAFIGELIIVLIPAGVMLLWYHVAGKMNSDRKIKKGKNNLRALIGERCLVLEDMSNIHDKGLVKLNGAVWTARCFDKNDYIEAGTIVVVKYIEGVKLVCTREK
jgi:membrane protein implicated in regulation of membrane protease activity